VLFFNENSYFKSMEYQQEIDRLEAEITRRLHRTVTSGCPRSNHPPDD